MKILLLANTDWYLYNFRRALAEKLQTRKTSTPEVAAPNIILLPSRYIGVARIYVMICMNAEVYMSRLRIISDRRDSAESVKSAILAELKRLEISLHTTERKMREFEERYKLSSDVFVRKFAAEDLAGGDSEYVAWAGELQIRDRLRAELQDLQEIEYVVN